MKIEIKNRFTDAVMYSHECDSNTVKITLEKANLEGVYLEGANLEGANLYSATYGSATLNNGIEQYLGLMWPVFLFDNHIKIGCQMHTVDEWENFDNKEIDTMSSEALALWAKYKTLIIGMARLHQGYVERSISGTA